MRAITFALCALLASSSVACDETDRTEDDTSSSRRKSKKKRGLIEEREDGRVEWRITSGGAVTALVADSEGQAVKPPRVGGSLTVNGRTVPLESGWGASLSAEIGELESDLTAVQYALQWSDGKSWDGVLHVPPGGTDALLAQPEVTVPEGTRGPHGGLVDVVGDQRVEIAIDDSTGELRAYFLDDNLEEVPVGDAELTVAVTQGAE